MRGICSVTTCDPDKKFPTKIHEAFEGVKDFNICWSCGDKILEQIELTTSEIDELKYNLILKKGLK